MNPDTAADLILDIAPEIMASKCDKIYEVSKLKGSEYNYKIIGILRDQICWDLAM